METTPPTPRRQSPRRFRGSIVFFAALTAVAGLGLTLFTVLRGEIASRGRAAPMTAAPVLDRIVRSAANDSVPDGGPGSHATSPSPARNSHEPAGRSR
jgi:hypothetical protein